MIGASELSDLFEYPKLEGCRIVNTSYALNWVRTGLGKGTLLQHVAILQQQQLKLQVSTSSGGRNTYQHI
jgi:hypothetical protein